MRIAAYHPSLEEYGGAESLVVQQMSALRSQGHSVRLVLNAYDEAAWSSAVSGLEVIEVHAGWRERYLHRKRWKKLRDRARLAAPHLDDAELVVAYNYPCSGVLSYIDLPNVVWHCCEPSRTVHLESANPELVRCMGEGNAGELLCGAWFQHERRYHRANPVLADERRCDLEGVAKVAGIVAISEYSGDLVHRVYGRKHDAIVYPAVSFPERCTPRSGLGRDGLRVLLHTRLHAHKNPDTVLRGFARFHARNPGSTLDVVGEGPVRADLETLAAECGVGSAVEFHGYLPQRALESVYARCDVLACLPMDEPFGLVFPEAAARGLMLIGPDHGGPMEILEGGRIGHVVNALDPDALCEALGEISSWTDPQVDRRRQEADRSCRSRFGAGVVGPKLEASLARFA